MFPILFQLTNEGFAASINNHIIWKMACIDLLHISNLIYLNFEVPP